MSIENWHDDEDDQNDNDPWMGIVLIVTLVIVMGICLYQKGMS